LLACSGRRAHADYREVEFVAGVRIVGPDANLLRLFRIRLLVAVFHLAGLRRFLLRHRSPRADNQFEKTAAPVRQRFPQFTRHTFRYKAHFSKETHDSHEH